MTQDYEDFGKYTDDKEDDEDDGDNEKDYNEKDDNDKDDALQVPRSTVKALINSKSGWLDQVGHNNGDYFDQVGHNDSNYIDQIVHNIGDYVDQVGHNDGDYVDGHLQIGDYWVIYLLSKNLNPIAMKELLEELKPVYEEDFINV